MNHLRDLCNRATPTHTQRHGKRFAYYASNRLISGGTDPTGWRLPAEALEGTLRQVIISHLRRAAERHMLVAEPDANGAVALHRRAMALVERLGDDPDLIGKILTSGSLAKGRLTLWLDPAVIASELGIAADALAAGLLTLSQGFALRRRGIETKIIAGETVLSPDLVLQHTLAEAHAWARDLRGRTSLTEIARKTGHSEPYIRTRIPLAFLSPRLQAAILDGRQPADMSVAQLLRDGIPMDWTEQARFFSVG